MRCAHIKTKMVGKAGRLPPCQMDEQEPLPRNHPSSFWSRLGVFQKASAMTKHLGEWAVGAGAGGVASGRVPLGEGMGMGG